MNRLRRAVLIVYCAIVLYCCVWIPWHYALPYDRYGRAFARAGYGWLWRGPNTGNSFTDSRSSPDLALITLRLLAATALCGAAYVIVRRIEK